MERLMVLQLDAGGCAAEVLLNGLPVAALPAAGGRSCIAVHEYLLAGSNRLELVIGPAAPGQDTTPQPRIATQPAWARVTLALLRQGKSPADADARQLAGFEWACEEGKSFDTPSSQVREVELPVAFPRWRWLDAPVITLTPAIQRQVLEFVQQLALELGRGNPEPLLAAAKLRYDELALAYQTTAPAAMQAFREQLQQRFEAKALKIKPPTAPDLVLRPLLGGRLLECLTPLGAPVLHTQNEDPALGEQAWPLRLAHVEGRIYVLR